MKIAFCHHLAMGYNAGGEQEIAEVATRLAQRGHEVTVHALPLSLGRRRLVEPEKLTGNLPYFEAWHHKVDCDVAYITYHPFCLSHFKVKSAKVAGFHSQVWFRKPSLSYGSVPLVAKLAYDLVGRPDLSRFDAIHLHDRYLHPAFKFANRPLFYIPHPVDTTKFRPPRTKNEEFTVIFCGRPDWSKGFDEFLTLARELDNEGIRFSWLGGNSSYPHVTSLGFTNDQEQIALAVGRAHVLVMPQRVDSLGRSSLEAIAVGTPVLLRANPLSVPALPSVYIAQSIQEFRDKIIEFKQLWCGGNFPRYIDSSGGLPSEYSLDSVARAYEEMFRGLA